MKIYIHTGEYYPVYEIQDDKNPIYFFGKPVDVDAATLDRWKKTIGEWSAVQEEMGAAYDAAIRPPDKRCDRCPHILRSHGIKGCRFADCGCTKGPS